MVISDEAVIVFVVVALPECEVYDAMSSRQAPALRLASEESQYDDVIDTHET